MLQLLVTDRAEGQILVSSDIRPDITDEGEAQGGKRARAPSGKTSPRRASAKDKGEGNDVGTVLRSVYQKTVGEDIPAEMLDLLSKLD